MSSLLKKYLEKVAEEEFEIEKEEINKHAQEGFPELKALLLEIKKMQSYDLLIQAEGSALTEAERIEKYLNILERANLIKGQTRFTDHDVYRRYVLTKKGDELAESLMKEG